MQLSNIKKEREDLEKLVNNFRSNTFNILAVLLLTSGLLYSQDVYRKGGTYTIDTITVIGLAILGMSIGIIFNNKPLQGSCGGVVENCVCLKGGDCDDPSQQPNISLKD